MAADTLRTLRREVRDQLRVRIDARGLASAPPAERRVRVRDEALDLLRQRGALLPQRELNRIVNEVSDDVVGFGPIESLLKDPTVTEVMVNGPDDLFVERRRATGAALSTGRRSGVRRERRAAPAVSVCVQPVALGNHYRSE